MIGKAPHLRPVRVLQRVDGVVVLVRAAGNVRDHARSRVSTQTLLQQARQLAVPERHVPNLFPRGFVVVRGAVRGAFEIAARGARVVCLFLSKRVDTVREREQGFVDVSAVP